ncbi:MAG: hypothetical protein M5U01_37920 [Ardenticatenaceae bacterium]|nr:hypothetical protein [Ardenticatenaceae bacterium]
MCGPDRTIYRWMDDALGERHHGHHHADHRRDSLADIEQEVRVLYARGDIDAGTFHRLKTLARSGELNWSDLARLRHDAAAPARREEPRLPRPRDAATVGGLNRLYAYRSRLEKARGEAEQMLQTLEAQASRLRAQAESAAESARLALPDEQRAREFLETREALLGHVGVLETRMASLREGLRRIETLRDQLATREAELKALESDEQLAELELRIREDLPNGE